MTAKTPREFRRLLKVELDKAIAEASLLVTEYTWAYNAFHDRTVGDEAKVRTAQADPTGSIVASKHRARRELERAARESVNAVVRCQNELDARSRNLERAMAQLKPGPSVRNPRFEAPIRGNAKLPKVDRDELAEAQARRFSRGEAYGG